MKNNKTFGLIIVAAVAVLLTAIILLCRVRDDKPETDPNSTDPSQSEIEGEDTPNVGEIVINGEKVQYQYEPQDENIIYEGDPANIGNNGGYAQNSISYTTRTGGTLFLGIDKDSNQDSIYLNPIYEPLDEEKLPWFGITQFAFYIKPEYGQVYTCFEEPSRYNSELNGNRKSLVILNHFHDTCVPGDYQTENDYGIIWTDPEFSMGAQPNDTVNLFIRIIRIFDSKLIDVVRATIVYDETLDAYRLDKIESADVHNTGEMSDAERSKLIQMAKDYLLSDEKRQSIGFQVDDWEWACEHAIVEHSRHPYFPKFISYKGEYVPAGKYSNCDVIAVNIPYIGFGYFTVYLAPETQIQGFLSAIPAGETKPTYQVLGYDVIFPQSEETAAFPTDLTS